MSNISVRASRRAANTAIRASAIVSDTSFTRLYSTEHPTASEETAQSLPSRWLSDVKIRIGHCITFGLSEQQKHEAGQILAEIARDWRELVAGSEGFLTSRTRRSMYRLPVVWGEQDSMGHVNNVVYNRYAETGRVSWASNFAKHIDPEHADLWRNLYNPKGEGLILKRITTEYKFPMTYPDHVTIYHRLAKEPQEHTETFDLQAVILSELHQRAAARVTEQNVLYDYTKGKKTPIKAFMLEMLRKTWHLQEEARRINSQRVVRILDRVRCLEKASWDRPDAVEDMGCSGR